MSSSLAHTTPISAYAPRRFVIFASHTTPSPPTHPAVSVIFAYAPRRFVIFASHTTPSFHAPRRFVIFASHTTPSPPTHPAVSVILAYAPHRFVISPTNPPFPSSSPTYPAVFVIFACAPRRLSTHHAAIAAGFPPRVTCVTCAHCTSRESARQMDAARVELSRGPGEWGLLEMVLL
jgi:hypothetical protein